MFEVTPYILGVRNSAEGFHSGGRIYSRQTTLAVSCDAARRVALKLAKFSGRLTFPGEPLAFAKGTGDSVNGQGFLSLFCVSAW